MNTQKQLNEEEIGILPKKIIQSDDCKDDWGVVEMEAHNREITRNV